MSDTKTIRLPVDIHRMLKLAAVEAGVTIPEFIKRVISSHTPGHGDQDETPDCPLCRPGGNIPNAETRKALEDSVKGIGLSKVYKDPEEMMRDLMSDDHRIWSPKSSKMLHLKIYTRLTLNPFSSQASDQ